MEPIIKSLEDVEFDDLFQAFSEAFKDYNQQLNEEQLDQMLTRRGFDPKLSFGAYIDGKLVSFIFNGIGFYEGFKTAYDTGTGTLKEYRGLGLATKIFRFSLPLLKGNGVQNYLLEVLQDNEPAINLYIKEGFKIVREFKYYFEKNEDIQIKLKCNQEYEISEGSLYEAVLLHRFCDFIPSWQNSPQAFSRCEQDFIVLLASVKDAIVGYSIFDPSTGDVAQLGVAPECRRKGIASMLIGEMIKLNKHDTIKVVNVETNSICMNKFLEKTGFSVKGKQYEMIKLL